MTRRTPLVLALVAGLLALLSPASTAASAASPAASAVSTAVTTAVSTAVSTAEVRVVHDLAYAPAEPVTSKGHLLDLYLPSGDRPRPLLIYTGGSGWLADTGKEAAASVAPYFTARGYAVAGVSIRSSSQAQFPAQVHDIKAAIRWLRGHARQYGLDPERFAVSGDSSGGWTAAMAALTGDVPVLEGRVGVTRGSSRVQAAVAFYPPTDFLQMDRQMLPGACESFNAIFGLTDCHDDPRSPESRLMGCPIQTCPQEVAQANPIRYVSPADPPVVVLHGQDDELVPHAQGVLLYNALRAGCREARLFSVPGAGHDQDEVLDPANHTRHTAAYTRDCRERSTTGAPDPTYGALAYFLDRVLAVR